MNEMAPSVTPPRSSVLSPSANPGSLSTNESAYASLSFSHRNSCCVVSKPASIRSKSSRHSARRVVSASRESLIVAGENSSSAASSSASAADCAKPASTRSFEIRSLETPSFERRSAMADVSSRPAPPPPRSPMPPRPPPPLPPPPPPLPRRPLPRSTSDGVSFPFDSGLAPPPPPAPPPAAPPAPALTCSLVAIACDVRRATPATDSVVAPKKRPSSWQKPRTVTKKGSSLSSSSSHSACACCMLSCTLRRSVPRRRLRLSWSRRSVKVCSCSSILRTRSACLSCISRCTCGDGGRGGGGDPHRHHVVGPWALGLGPWALGMWTLCNGTEVHGGGA